MMNQARAEHKPGSVALPIVNDQADGGVSNNYNGTRSSYCISEAPQKGEKEEVRRIILDESFMTPFLQNDEVHA